MYTMWLCSGKNLHSHNKINNCPLKICDTTIGKMGQGK